MTKNFSNTESLVKAIKSTRHAELSRSESEASKNLKPLTNDLDSIKILNFITLDFHKLYILTCVALNSSNCYKDEFLCLKD